MDLKEKIEELIESHNKDCEATKEDIILSDYLSSVLEMIPRIGYKPLNRWYKVTRMALGKVPNKNEIVIGLLNGSFLFAQYNDGIYIDISSGEDITEGVSYWREAPQLPV